MLRVAVALVEAPPAGAVAVTVACPPQQLGGMMVRMETDGEFGNRSPKGAHLRLSDQRRKRSSKQESVQCEAENRSARQRQHFSALLSKRVRVCTARERERERGVSMAQLGPAPKQQRKREQPGNYSLRDRLLTAVDGGGRRAASGGRRRRVAGGGWRRASGQRSST